MTSWGRGNSHARPGCPQDSPGDAKAPPISWHLFLGDVAVIVGPHDLLHPAKEFLLQTLPLRKPHHLLAFELGRHPVTVLFEVALNQPLKRFEPFKPLLLVVSFHSGMSITFAAIGLPPS